jgi:hypothetical protein
VLSSGSHKTLRITNVCYHSWRNSHVPCHTVAACMCPGVLPLCRRRRSAAWCALHLGRKVCKTHTGCWAGYNGRHPHMQSHFVRHVLACNLLTVVGELVCCSAVCGFDLLRSEKGKR